MLVVDLALLWRLRPKLMTVTAVLASLAPILLETGVGSDVMKPIDKVVTVRPETTVAETLELSAKAGVDRLPVIAADGQAAGIVNVLDILFDQAEHKSIASYMRRAVAVTENEPAYRIIQRLRATRLGLAAVINSERRLIGFVTGEDAIKRLVQINP